MWLRTYGDHPLGRLGIRRRRRLGLHRQLSRVGDLDGLRRLAALAPEALDLLDDVHALQDLSEDDVASIEPRGLHRADEELAAVGAGAGVGHREDARARVLELEVLVVELLAVDGLAARAVAPGEVAALQHELRDDAVELGPLVVQGLARLAHALLTRAERTEVLDRLGHRGAVQPASTPLLLACGCTGAGAGGMRTPW